MSARLDVRDFCLINQKTGRSLEHVLKQIDARRSFHIMSKIIGGDRTHLVQLIVDEMCLLAISLPEMVLFIEADLESAS